MTDDLDQLSTHELHDRAVHRAEKHLDVKFLWSLLEMIPAAETASGDVGEADYDIESSKGLISDAVHSGDGALGEFFVPPGQRSAVQVREALRVGRQRALPLHPGPRGQAGPGQDVRRRAARSPPGSAFRAGDRYGVHTRLYLESASGNAAARAGSRLTLAGTGSNQPGTTEHDRKEVQPCAMTGRSCGRSRPLST